MTDARGRISPIPNKCPFAPPETRLPDGCFVYVFSKPVTLPGVRGAVAFMLHLHGRDYEDESGTETFRTRRDGFRVRVFSLYGLNGRKGK